MPEFVIFFLWV